MRAQRAGGRSRCVVRTRETFVPLALFALAFVGALLVMRQPGADAPDEAHAPAQARAEAAGRASSLRRVSAVSTGSAVRAASLLGAARAASEPGLWGTFVSSAESGQSAGERESDGRDAERREVSGDSAQPEPPPVTPVDAQLASATVGAAIDTLKYSGSPEDRARAIRSLSGTARNGAEVARVRSSLHLAATDDDPDIAARAQEEYEALVERDDR